MPVLTEGQHAGEFLVREFDPEFNREVVTVVSGQALAAGAVIGKITLSGKYAAYDNAAADGTEAAAGILYAAVDASAADAEGVAILRGPAVVNTAELVWDAGQDAAAQTAGLVDLAALDIIAR